MLYTGSGKSALIPWIVAITLIPAAIGCTRARTTALKRVGGDVFTASSNGSLKRNMSPRPFRGVPVVLEVPTHYAVTVTETVYLYSSGSSAESMKEVLFDGSNGVPRILDAEIEVVKRRKLFSLDIARPAAGTYSSTMSFSGTTGPGNGETGEKLVGHLTSINSQIDDQTIKNITSLLESDGIKKLLAKGAGPKEAARKVIATGDTGGALKNKYHQVKRTVAYAMFDIDSPYVEQQITSFLEQHISGCHGCKGWSVATSNASEAADLSADGIPGSNVNPAGFGKATYQPDKIANAAQSRPRSTENTSDAPTRLQEKEKPFLVTPGYTLYEVEIIVDGPDAIEHVVPEVSS